MSLKDFQNNWGIMRGRLEREMRVLVVDGDQASRKHLDELLFRMHIPARSVGSAEQALQLVERERYSVVISADVLPGMHGITLIRTLRERLPTLDLLLTTHSPSLRILSQAFELNLLDVWQKPFADLTLLGNRVRQAVRRHADQRMRSLVLNELRQVLANLGEDQHLRATTQLEKRLSAFKRSLGAFDCVLVVEGTDMNLRLLSEHLLLAGLRVETVVELDHGLERLVAGGVHLVVADVGTAPGIEALLARLKQVAPDTEHMLVALKPTVADAQTALRSHVAAYVPWPPTSLSRTAERAREVLRRGRRDRLVDNLFVELYCETSRACGQEPTEDFPSFQSLIGLERVLTAEQPQAAPEESSPAEYLEEVLTEMLADYGPPKNQPAVGSERREHDRVAQNQFLRFRLAGQTAYRMAYLADLGQGGIFVRVNEHPPRGTVVDVDFNVEHGGRHYRVECHGEVAWVARTPTDSPHGAGFGVRFVDAADDVVELMQEIVTTREGNDGSGDGDGSATR